MKLALVILVACVVCALAVDQVATDRRSDSAQRMCADASTVPGCGVSARRFLQVAETQKEARTQNNSGHVGDAIVSGSPFAFFRYLGCDGPTCAAGCQWTQTYDALSCFSSSNPVNGWGAFRIWCGDYGPNGSLPLVYVQPMTSCSPNAQLAAASTFPSSTCLADSATSDNSAGSYEFECLLAAPPWPPSPPSPPSPPPGQVVCNQGSASWTCGGVLPYCGPAPFECVPTSVPCLTGEFEFYCLDPAATMCCGQFCCDGDTAYCAPGANVGDQSYDPSWSPNTFVPGVCFARVVLAAHVRLSIFLPSAMVVFAVGLCCCCSERCLQTGRRGSRLKNTGDVESARACNSDTRGLLSSGAVASYDRTSRWASPAVVSGSTWAHPEPTLTVLRVTTAFGVASASTKNGVTTTKVVIRTNDRANTDTMTTRAIRSLMLAWTMREIESDWANALYMAAFPLLAVHTISSILTLVGLALVGADPSSGLAVFAWIVFALKFGVLFACTVPVPLKGPILAWAVPLIYCALSVPVGVWAAMNLGDPPMCDPVCPNPSLGKVVLALAITPIVVTMAFPIPLLNFSRSDPTIGELRTRAPDGSHLFVVRVGAFICLGITRIVNVFCMVSQ